MASQKIDIVTAHNIVMRFELANTIQRILAWVIDAAILFVYLLLCGTVMGGNTIMMYLFVLPIFTFYNLFFEVFNNGQSIGKMVLKIRVVALNGSTPTLTEYYLRWIFRTLDITFSLGTIAILFISSSKRRQRIGDLIAGTSVVKLKNDSSISLADIDRANKIAEIEYLKLVAFTDSDMLLVKQSLLRYGRYPNNANKELMFNLSEKIQDVLGIKIEKKNTRIFLDKVLNEYIELTR
ncbi:MAG: RDD family protein [Saprospiraceae bacterium]|nr:RDD family protein [Bacteroidia bacterium]NNL93083.1 RDD family protein [Saprospiraceae bacterium]